MRPSAPCQSCWRVLSAVWALGLGLVSQPSTSWSLLRVSLSLLTQANLNTAVGQWVDEHTEDLLQLTETLIRFQSENHVPTGWEKEAQMFVAEALRRMNLEVDIFEPSEVPGFTEHPAYWPGRDY